MERRAVDRPPWNKVYEDLPDTGEGRGGGYLRIPLSIRVERFNEDGLTTSCALLALHRLHCLDRCHRLAEKHLHERT